MIEIKIDVPIEEIIVIGMAITRTSFQPVGLKSRIKTIWTNSMLSPTKKALEGVMVAKDVRRFLYSKPEAIPINTELGT